MCEVGVDGVMLNYVYFGWIVIDWVVSTFGLMEVVEAKVCDEVLFGCLGTVVEFVVVVVFLCLVLVVYIMGMSVFVDGGLTCGV